MTLQPQKDVSEIIEHNNCVLFIVKIIQDENSNFQEQIDNELVPYKLPDGSVIQVRPALPSCYTLLCSSTVVSQPWVGA